MKDENKRVCENCRYYLEGECRRYPPQVACESNSECSSGVFNAFPKVDKNEWCGEFSLWFPNWEKYEPRIK